MGSQSARGFIEMQPRSSLIDQSSRPYPRSTPSLEGASSARAREREREGEGGRERGRDGPSVGRSRWTRTRNLTESEAESTGPGPKNEPAAPRRCDAVHPTRRPLTRRSRCLRRFWTLHTSTDLLDLGGRSRTGPAA